MAKQMKPHPEGSTLRNPHAKKAIVHDGIGGGKGKGYDGSSHGGSGRNQNLMWPAAGELYNKPLPHTGQAVVGPPQGAGHSGKGEGYQTDAHTGSHHGPNGQAVGSVDDHKPMRWKSPLHTENVAGMPKEGSHGKAMHHTQPQGDAHRFKTSNSGHGYGHSVSQMKGPLRMSGHSRAHRIGAK